MELFPELHRMIIDLIRDRNDIVTLARLRMACRSFSIWLDHDKIDWTIDDNIDGNIREIVRHGHLDVIKRLYWSGSSEVVAILVGRRTALVAALYGQLPILKWIRKMDFIIPKHIAEEACRGGCLEVVKWLYNKKYPLGIDELIPAFEQGFIEIIDWIHGMAPDLFRKDNRPCETAAYHGQVEVLNWLSNNRCRWFTSRAAYQAAGQGHISVLSWALGEGCYLDCKMTAQAAGGDHLDTLKWLRANGCPWDRRTYLCGENNEAIREYLLKEKCPTEMARDQVHINYG